MHFGTRKQFGLRFVFRFLGQVLEVDIVVAQPGGPLRPGRSRPGQAALPAGRLVPAGSCRPT